MHRNEKSEIDEKECSEIKVKLIIIGFDCSSELVSTTLGLKPDEVWHIGEKVLPQASNVHAENGWVLRSPVDPKRTILEEAITALMDIIPGPEKFSKLPQGSQVILECVIFINSSKWPYIGVSSSLVRRLAAIGAEIDFDIYQ